MWTKCFSLKLNGWKIWPKLIIYNNDKTPEEFESYELNREKIIMGNSKSIVFIGPLEPGKYPFFGEFNIKTAQGIIIAVESEK